MANRMKGPLFGLCALAACAGSAPPSPPKDGSDAGDPGPPGPRALHPITQAPPGVGDGRLPDVPDETPGGSPDGWDFCRNGLVGAPRPGKSDPPASRGDRYWLYSSPQPGTDPAPPLAQAYFYFGQRLAPGGKGLWFDATLVSGSADATFELFAVDKVCEKPAPLGSFSMSPLLATPGRWASTCVELPVGQLLDGLGIRLVAANAEIGLDAFRLGPPCPPMR
jgi:hypothetical protein